MISSIQTIEGSVNLTLQQWFAAILETGAANAVLAPAMMTDAAGIKPCLITRPDQVDRTIPLGPGFFVNAGGMVSRLTRHPAGRTTAVWLRPCEIKAFVELAKLHQGTRDEVVIVGMDCPMALSRTDYDTWAETHPDPVSSDQWVKTLYASPDSASDRLRPAPACRVCDTPYPVNADVSVLLLGADLEQGVTFQADTKKGAAFLEKLSLDTGQVPPKRKEVLAEQTRVQENAFLQLDEGIREQTGSMEKLGRFFSACINCHNCRSVCPVCYCKTCVFSTDVFQHEALQYHRWADKWGRVPLPFDTLFFHLTRMAHMGLSCTGCGQCTHACPSKIPVADLFISVSRQVRKAFDYVPGRDDAEPLPLAVFKEAEFADTVGLAGDEEE